MAEKIGQYYFEVEKGEFVNRGRAIELDERGSKRWSWRNFGVTLAVASAAAFVGGFAGAGIVGVLKGIPLLELGSSRI